MDIYSTEEEQEEAINRFLKENGTSLVIGVIVGLGGIYGWNYYQKAQLEVMAQNSLAFSEVVEQVAKPESLLVDGEKVVTEYSSSQYSQLAQLLMVKTLVEKKDFDQAVAILNQVIASDVTQAVKSIATMRLARIEAAQQKNDQALKTLTKLTDVAFVAQKNELQGDIYLAQGNQDGARTPYQAAIHASPEQSNPDLQMKLNDLTPAA